MQIGKSNFLHLLQQNYKTGECIPDVPLHLQSVVILLKLRRICFAQALRHTHLGLGHSLPPH